MRESIRKAGTEIIMCLRSYALAVIVVDDDC